MSCVELREAKPRAGMRRRSNAAALRFAKGSLRCSVSWPGRRRGGARRIRVRRPGEGEGPLIYVSCDVGVGAGIVLNDRLFTGSQGLAGEIGHTIVAGRRPAVLVRAPRLCRGVRRSRAPLPAEAACNAAAACSACCCRTCGRCSTRAPSWSAAESCIGTPRLLQVALETLDGYAQVAGMPAPSVRPARHGLLATAVGAAALVLHQDLRPLQRQPGAARTRVASDGEGR